MLENPISDKLMGHDHFTNIKGIAHNIEVIMETLHGWIS